MNPAITITLPVYNGGAYLIKSIESVLNQTFKNFELLIVDDCSTDDSFKYLQSLDDPRITVFKNEKNQGLFYNLNFLIKKSSSGLLKLWAQDDVMHPECLTEVCNFHKKFPQAGFSFTGRQMIDANGDIIKNSDSSTVSPMLISTKEHTRIAFFTGSIAGNIANVCLSKKAVDKAGLFQENMKISGDFDMLVRLAKNNPVGYIPNIFVQIREHAGQLSMNGKYHVNHVREDLRVYRTLIGYSDRESVIEGRALMRNHKLVYYYTLMVKAVLKGKLKSAYGIAWSLAAFDNFFLLTAFFIKAKISKPKKPSWI